MKMDRRKRLHYRVQSGVFVLLFVALLAALGWLSNRYSTSFDLSANQRNSLSPESLRLLDGIEEPLEITLFASPVFESRRLLEELFSRFGEAQPRIEFETLNPDLYPELLRSHDIRFDGEVLLEYRGRSEKLSRVDEAAVSNAIQRLLRGGDRWLVFLQGHGERDPYSEANHDYSQFATRLAATGFTIETINLARDASLPDNTDVLLLTSPRVELLPGELDMLREYLARGGNLLWMADPDQAIDGLETLNDEFAIDFLPGIVVDPKSQLMGLDRVDFALVAEFPHHPVTRDLSSIVLFPQAQAIEFFGENEWHRQTLLRSDERSWNETGPLRGEIVQGDDDDEIQGPLDLALSLERSIENADGDVVAQRVSIVGDADLLSNRYLGNGSNLEFGVNLVNWLSQDDSLISITPRPAPDTRLELSSTQQIAIAVFFLLLLPILLFASGLRIWFKRRKL